MGGGKLNGETHTGMKMPVEASLGIAKLIGKLRIAYLKIEQERVRLVKKYGRLNDENSMYFVSPENADYALEFASLLVREWDEEFEFEKVKLPQTVKNICKSCGTEMDVVFRIEANSLIPLVEHFVEVI